MVASESSASAVQWAMRNVEANGLQTSIAVLHVSGETVIKDVLDKCGEQGVLDFCMCNPPFYESMEQMQMLAEQKEAYFDGDHVLLGEEHELVTPGWLLLR